MKREKRKFRGVLIFGTY